ncbi:hypothetical protein BLNAU_21137 [Blattamonas nauphoetae]|uniref:Uncharacterized protein n=1 Tax=Blattamonas nauphoetae TaxID=2049346 RepID=A0ABQ9WWR4_9EUKA|nr:hypothetical protein BLNAU_21137 [Blattamonas nauphoetae]
MSEQTSTASKDSDESLLKHENVKSLTSLVASKCESGEEVEWKELMEWFVCAVIGLNSKGLESNGSFWFDWDDVVVDGFGTARINLSPSHSDSSPLHSPQSFSGCITRLSLLFLDFIDQLSISKCLPKLVEQPSKKTVISSVIRHLMHLLINTGNLILTCDTLTFENTVTNIVNSSTNYLVQYDRDLTDTMMLSVQHVYDEIFSMEQQGLVKHADRLNDSAIPYFGPYHGEFADLFDPELAKMRKQFDPDLYTDANRISSWKKLLQKVVCGEEVEDDTSFLKLSFFRPTLLSLQAKFQTLASPKDGPDDNSTLSLHSSHSSPLTSLDAHLDPSLRTHSSSPNFRQESLRLLTILHSLLTSPLTYSNPEHFPSDIFETKFIFDKVEPVNPNERFNSSLFDVGDDEILTRSLIRCHSAFKSVGAEKCIDDLFNFIDRLVFILHTSDSFLRTAAFFLFKDLVETSCVLPLLPHLWDRLRYAFRDGQLEEQFSLIWISMFWNLDTLNKRSLPPFPAAEFDWDGLISADLHDFQTFICSIRLLEYLRFCSITFKMPTTELTRIILSFEQHQDAVSRIDLIFHDIQERENPHRHQASLVSFCLLVSLRTDFDFPPIVTTVITQHTDITGAPLLCHENKVFFLCHTSLGKGGLSGPKNSK